MQKEMENSKWKELWQNRTVENIEEIKKGSFEEIFLNLKRINGFDILDGGITYQEFYKQYIDTKVNLESNSEFHGEKKQIFEIGCGDGANLLLFANDDYIVGGIDYSQNLIELAEKVLSDVCTKELIVGEAIDMPCDIKYDMIFSNSVFSYFRDMEYAEAVLEKMLLKSRYSLGILDVHDMEKKEEFIAYRRKIIDNYDEKYKGLSKLFL